MSDLFHQDVPLAFIKKVFSVMRRANWHQYQLLTKRSERLLEVSPVLAWEPHIWIGVSVENEDYTDRIDDLRKTGADVKFLSLEPLLGPLRQLKLKNIDWVIVGGESGPNARPMHPDWVRSVRDQCQAAGVPFFFKQWGEWGTERPAAIRSRTRILHPALIQGHNGSRDLCMWRIGKKAAGAKLDGCEWRKFPKRI
jgi:protein gp37